MMKNSVDCEEEDDGDIGDSARFDLQDENSYIVQLEQFLTLPNSDLTAIASEHLDQINYISQECSEIPNSRTFPRCSGSTPYGLTDAVAGCSSCGRGL